MYAALQTLRGTDDVELEMQEMHNEQRQKQDTGKQKVLYSLCSVCTSLSHEKKIVTNAIANEYLPKNLR